MHSSKSRVKAEILHNGMDEGAAEGFNSNVPSVAEFKQYRLLPAITSEVYESYWTFAAERQAIYMRRVRGEPGPWTTDDVLLKHKFTNAYRAADRVSQFLIRRVIYRDDLPATGEEILFRIVLFKLFNKIETWLALESALGPITYAAYSFESYNRVLSEQMRNGARIYSAAYIMPPGNNVFGSISKHQNHLRLIELMMARNLAAQLGRKKNMQSAFELLLEFPTLGNFLAYQLVTDINYSELTNFSEMEFVVPGPGARDGLKKCFVSPGGLSEHELIRVISDTQEEEFRRRNLRFESLWGRKLQLIDCQNLLCEISKYSRVTHPHIVGTSGRQRIKQLFVQNGSLPQPWFPPKWGINERIGCEVGVYKTDAGRQLSLWGS